jgi:hypothetical protein
MDRKGFLRRFGGMFGAALIAPQLLKGIDISDNTEPTLKAAPKTVESNLDGYDLLSEEDRKMTEMFFKYLKDNNVGFKWERVYTPVFQLKDDRALQVATRRLRTNFNPLWKEGFSEVISPSPSASTLTYHQYNTLDEYYEVLFAEICTELRYNPAPERFYIYYIMTTPTMYNPEDFTPNKGLMIRSANV